MAEGLGGSPPLSDDFLDEEKYLLHFDLPDNDQTWLYCPPGDDPDRVVDLTEWLNIRPSFLATQSHLSDNVGHKGHVIDTRTYTRTKKQTVLEHGKIPHKHIFVDDDLSSKTDMSSSSKLPLTLAPAKELKEVRAPFIKNEYEQLQQNKENLNISSNVNKSGRTEHKAINRSRFRLSDEFSLLENVSYPQSFFSDLSTSESSSISETIQNKAVNNQAMGQSQCPLNTTFDRPHDVLRSIKIDSSLADNPAPLNITEHTPPEDDKFKDSFVFLPPLVSTPTNKVVRESFIPHLKSPESKKTHHAKSHAQFDLAKLIKGQQSTNCDNIDDSFNNNILEKLDETFCIKKVDEEELESRASKIEDTQQVAPVGKDKLNTTLTLKKASSRDKLLLSHSKELDSHETTFLVSSRLKKNEKNYTESKILPPISSAKQVRAHENNPMSSIKLWSDKNTKSSEKESESRPDSCYSSSSNVRSIGDICALAQDQEESLTVGVIRKSLSHDSLLSMPDTNIPVARKHESTSNLTSCQSFGSGLRKPGFLSRTDIGGLKQTSIPVLKTKSGIPKGGRSLPKPVICRDENISKSSYVAEPKSLPVLKEQKPSGIKQPTTAVSRIPRGSGIPKPSTRSSELIEQNLLGIYDGRRGLSQK